jgi:hypothetical protein
MIRIETVTASQRRLADETIVCPECNGDIVKAVKLWKDKIVASPEREPTLSPECRRCGNDGTIYLGAQTEKLILFCPGGLFIIGPVSKDVANKFTGHWRTNKTFPGRQDDILGGDGIPPFRSGDIVTCYSTPYDNPDPSENMAVSVAMVALRSLSMHTVAYVAIQKMEALLGISTGGSQ